MTSQALTNVQSFLHPSCRVADKRTSAGTMRAVYASQAINKGELVAMWGGIVYPSRNQVPPELAHFLLQIDESLFLGPASVEHVDDAEFFNHSCNPNCGIQGQVALVAMRTIQPGEELTFDYAMAETYDQAFDCQCGADQCRRIIRGSDHESPELRQRYAGYFSAWLEKKHRAPAANRKFLANFEELGAWGIDTNLDLKDCNADKIRSAEVIHDFTVQLCERIKVKRFGEPIIVHFGEDERVAGYSLVQLIETSLVSGHFANLTNRVYLDVFSCAYYDPQEVAEFSANFFEASDFSVHTQLRF